MHVRVSLECAECVDGEPDRKRLTPMHSILMCEPTFCNGVSICDRTKSAQYETNDEERREKNVYGFMNCLAIRLVLTLHSINQAILLESTDSMLCNLFFLLCVAFISSPWLIIRIVCVCAWFKERILFFEFIHLILHFHSNRNYVWIKSAKPQNEINSPVAFLFKNTMKNMWSKRRKSHSRNKIMATFNNFIIFIIISHSFWRIHMGYTRSLAFFHVVRLFVSHAKNTKKWHAEKHE